MKKNIFLFAVVLLTAFVGVSCSNEDILSEVPTPNPSKEVAENIVTFTATLDAKGGSGMRAVSASGATTWVANEEILIPELIEKFKDRWDWSELSDNTDLKLTYDLIDKYIGRWDWDRLINRGWYNNSCYLYSIEFFNRYAQYIPMEDFENSSLWNAIVEEEENAINLKSATRLGQFQKSHFCERHKFSRAWSPQDWRCGHTPSPYPTRRLEAIRSVTSDKRPGSSEAGRERIRIGPVAGIDVQHMLS